MWCLQSINFVDVETKGGDGKVTFQVMLVICTMHASATAAAPQ